MGHDPGLLTERDGDMLALLERDWRPLTEEWRRLLGRKLAAARLPAGAEIPPGLATIGARVDFRCQSGLADCRTLCLPRDTPSGRALLPITTFYGLALLGLREGERLDFDRPEGRRDWIVLEKVVQRPGDEEPPLAWPSFRLIAGGLDERSFEPANENGPGQGPGPSAA